jgi:TatD DNase family protein
MSHTLIDSHAHLTSEAIFPILKDVLARAQTAHVKAIINICTDASSFERGLELAKQCPWIFNAAATTPHDVAKEGELMFSLFAAAAHAKTIVAVGETGLDYHYEYSPKEIQQEFLRRYLQLALDSQLPVIIHCREAFKDLLEILDKHFIVDGAHAPGVLHCFTGTIEEAKQIVERGWFISLSGIATFKRSLELKEVARLIPIEHLLIETDSPYLAPQSKRGLQNEPAFISEVAEMIASVKGMTLTEVAKATTGNARRLFKIE